MAIIRSLMVKISADTTELTKGLKTVQNNINTMTSLLNALGTIKVFDGITEQVKKGVDAFNQYNNSIVGLKSVVRGTGNDFARAQKFIEEYISDGLISAADAATALKNLLFRGYTQTQAENALYRLKDAAVFGRQSSLELGQAVASATEGLKNENSRLVKVNCPIRKRFLVA